MASLFCDCVIATFASHHIVRQGLANNACSVVRTSFRKKHHFVGFSCEQYPGRHSFRSSSRSLLSLALPHPATPLTLLPLLPSRRSECHLGPSQQLQPFPPQPPPSLATMDDELSKTDSYKLAMAMSCENGSTGAGSNRTTAPAQFSPTAMNASSAQGAPTTVPATPGPAPSSPALSTMTTITTLTTSATPSEAYQMTSLAESSFSKVRPTPAKKKVSLRLPFESPKRTDAKDVGRDEKIDIEATRRPSAASKNERER